MVFIPMHKMVSRWKKNIFLLWTIIMTAFLSAQAIIFKALMIDFALRKLVPAAGMKYRISVIFPGKTAAEVEAKKHLK